MDLQYAKFMFYPRGHVAPVFDHLSAKPDPGRQDCGRPAMHPMPSGVPATPTTVAQTYGIGGGGTRRIHPADGGVVQGREGDLQGQSGGGIHQGNRRHRIQLLQAARLEEAIQKIGAELHSQYFVSYTPNNKDEGGFHTLEVTVGPYKTQTRPGYWLGHEADKNLIRYRFSTRRLLVTEKTPLTPCWRGYPPCLYRPDWRLRLPASLCRYPR